MLLVLVTCGVAQDANALAGLVPSMLRSEPQLPRQHHSEKHEYARDEPLGRERHRAGERGRGRRALLQRCDAYKG